MKSFQKLFMKRIIMNNIKIIIDNIKSVKSINDLNK